MTLAERLTRLRNYQSRDFWAMVFARPLTILLLLPLAERRWVTPDRITVLAVLTKSLGIYILAAHPEYTAGIVAATLVNLGLVLDNMDGTLARFRRCGTFFGYYFDKVADATTLALIFWAAGFRAYGVTSNPLDLVLPSMGIGAAMVAGYAKWVADRVLSDLQLKARVDRPAALQQVVAERIVHDRPTPVPARTARDWLRWFRHALLSILLVNEVDLFFWLGLALVLDFLPLFTRAISSLLVLGLLIGPAVFAVKVWRAERRGG